MPVEMWMLSLENWDTSLDLNLRAPFLLARKPPKNDRGGLIVNITDVGAHKAWSRYPSYTVSKAALESLTRILARGLAPKIRVNAIAPGFVLQSEHRPDRRVGAAHQSDSPQTSRANRGDRLCTRIFIEERVYYRADHCVDGGYSLI
jgi:NAD(P)-dependent dehydrogenase (short-subunit alcohol dehydrogenase family)